MHTYITLYIFGIKSSTKSDCFDKTKSKCYWIYKKFIEHDIQYTRIKIQIVKKKWKDTVGCDS
jgi:hypothetical protein